MRIEITEVVRMEEHRPLSLAELADLSRLTEDDLLELVDCGVIEPGGSGGGRLSFRADYLVVARTAARLKQELDLDTHGTAVALALIERIRELESQVQRLLARGQA